MADPTGPSPVRRKLRIGIVGAGLVGASAALALQRLPNVEVTSFEKAPTAREAGAWISLNVSAIKVLSRFIRPADISQIVYRPPDRAVYTTRHWRTGEALVLGYSSDGLLPEYIHARTHRWPLLELILKHVPNGTIQYGRRVVDVEEQQNGIKLVLENDQEKKEADRSPPFDLIVAADGIYSGLRKKYWPDHKVQYKGAVAYRTIFPVSKLKSIAHLLHDDSSSWRKDGEVVFLSELGLGQYGVVIIRGETPEFAAGLKWEHSIGSYGLDRLRSLYKDWDPIISQVLALVEDIDAYPLDSGPWLKTLSSPDSRVVFVGDASHPTAGAFGSGAAMGICDVWALSRALEASQRRKIGSDSFSSYDVRKAIRIFEKTRVPFLSRAEQQMDIDKANGQYIAAAQDEDEWTRRFKERIRPTQWLGEHDVELEVQKIIGEEPLRSAL